MMWLCVLRLAGIKTQRPTAVVKAQYQGFHRRLN